MVDAVYSTSARKALRRMPRNQADLILGKIELLLSEPNVLARNVTNLVNEPGHRLRVGDWRVLFERKGDTVVVWNIAPRGSAYR